MLSKLEEEGKKHILKLLLKWKEIKEHSHAKNKVRTGSQYISLTEISLIIKPGDQFRFWAPRQTVDRKQSLRLYKVEAWTRDTYIKQVPKGLQAQCEGDIEMHLHHKRRTKGNVYVLTLVLSGSRKWTSFKIPNQKQMFYGFIARIYPKSKTPRHLF